MLFWILAGIALWILGMIIFYILDGWFDYGAEGEDTGLFIFIAVIWPLWICFVIPGLLASKAHDALKEKKKQHVEEQEAKIRIRVAEEKELKKIEEELDSYVEPEPPKKARLKRVR